MKRLLALLACLSILWASAAVAQQQSLTVSAAVSLTEAMKDLGKAFEAANPGVTVAFNLGASGQLYQQLEQGAPVDVFVSADQKWMDKAQQADLLAPGLRKDIAANALVLAVPAGNPAKVTSLSDLAAERVKRVAMGNPRTVPAGAYAQGALDAGGLTQAVSSKLIYAESVRQALDYLARGEVDAGLVYATDAKVVEGRVSVAAQVPTTTRVTYPMAVLKAAAKPALAAKFLDLTVSPEGQQILARYGFSRP